MKQMFFGYTEITIFKGKNEKYISGPDLDCYLWP